MSALTVAIKWMDSAPDGTVDATSFLNKLSEGLDQVKGHSRNDRVSLHNLMVILRDLAE